MACLYFIMLCLQLTSTTNDMHSQARKAKARKHDLNYYKDRAEDLEQENNLLNTKLVRKVWKSISAC